MLRGLYTAAAGMISQQRKHDTITNNISNLNTPGFKQGNAVSRSFPEMLLALSGSNAGQPASPPIGRLSTGVMAEEDLSIYLQGDLQQTENPFDLAIVSNIQTPGLVYDASGKAITADGQRVFQPQAFFTVQNENGEQRYSRNGKFSVNDAGQVVTAEGYRILGRDGQPLVLIDPVTGTFIPNAKITADGFFIDSVNGRPLLNQANQQLGVLISRVENPNRLIREGNGVYRVNPGEENSVTQLAGTDQVEVRQGFLERSNVDAAQSMVDMMTAQRAYEANQKMIQYYDRSLDKAVNEVGRI